MAEKKSSLRVKMGRRNADVVGMEKNARDAGTTLAELMVVIALVGVLTALAALGIRGWAVARAFGGAPVGIQSVLRVTQQQAITEGTSFCVDFDVAANTYSVYRFACTDPARVKVRGPFDMGSGSVHLSEPAFLDPTETAWPGVTYRPRGSAWPGSVTVRRDGSTSTHVITVDGLVGRAAFT